LSRRSVVSAYEHRPIPALIIRKESKGHGTRAYIEGPSLPAGSLVVVLEDVVTTGQSALKAVERLRQAGYSVNQVMALVDRQQGSRVIPVSWAVSVCVFDSRASRAIAPARE